MKLGGTGPGRLVDCRLSAYSVKESKRWAEQLKLDGREATIARDIVTEIKGRLSFMEQVGWVTSAWIVLRPLCPVAKPSAFASRPNWARTCKACATCSTSPPLALHPRDNQLLLNALHTLGQEGNTLVVVEHDEDTIRRAEHVIDIGPGAGQRGGTVVAEGTVQDIMASPDSVTGRCLREPMQHPLGQRREITPELEQLTLHGAKLHNLQNVTVKVPLKRLVAVTGVVARANPPWRAMCCWPMCSTPSASHLKERDTTRPQWHGCTQLEGWGAVDRVLEVDQTPIGKTPRSCPATTLASGTPFANCLPTPWKPRTRLGCRPLQLQHRRRTLPCM